jgi:hypothetical protein
VKENQIEQETEIDFFPGINAELENQLEGNINISVGVFRIVKEAYNYIFCLFSNQGVSECSFSECNR